MEVNRLYQAKVNKKDEFYTQIKDIENELQYYVHHFKNKIIFMNADDPSYSNFWKYFKDNFSKLKLRKIICTYYNPKNEVYKTEYDGVVEKKTKLIGNGDFRSGEIIKIMNTADIIVTNPPFSIFRELIKVLDDNNKKFIIIGHQNAITQKLTFKLIKEGKLWLGRGFKNNVEYFINNHYDDYTIIGKKIDGLIRVSGVTWYTNLKIDDGRKPLELTEVYSDDKYPKYDNYDAINVDRVNKIPKDYFGEMGVPITFLNKYVSEQFEIIDLDIYLENHEGVRFQINGKTKYARIIIKRKD